MGASSVDLAKQAAARAGAGLVQRGSRLALGSGSTTEEAIRALSARFPDGDALVTAASSARTEALARSLHFRVEPMNPQKKFDLMLDGADEVSDDLALVKGGGGALFREKLLARRSQEVVILVDASKLVHRLGERHAIPVEVVPFARDAVAHEVQPGGFRATLRKAAGGAVYLTDNGNEILDLAPKGSIVDPAAVERALRSIPGVVEVGLFVDLADRVIVGHPDGTVEERRPARARR
jgi:ribose 5-phosphate isomerase A